MSTISGEEMQLKRLAIEQIVFDRTSGKNGLDSSRESREKNCYA